MRKIARMALIGATVALAMGATVTAQAAPNVQVVLVSGGAVTTAPGKSTPKVTCPTGMQVTGGGASNNSPGGVFLTGGGPADGGRSWVEQVRNTLASSTTVTVWAQCAQGLSTYREVDSTTTVTPNNGGGAQATCANNEHLLGGGASNNGTDIDPVSTQNGNGWWFGLFNHDSAPVTATTQALCGNGFTNYNEYTGDITTIQPGKVGGAFGPCPTGWWPISGGGAAQSIPNTKITDSYPVAGGWWTYIQNNNSTPITMLTHANCAS